MISKILLHNGFIDKPKISLPRVQKTSCVVNKNLLETIQKEGYRLLPKWQNAVLGA